MQEDSVPCSLFKAQLFINIVQLDLFVVCTPANVKSAFIIFFALLAFSLRFGLMVDECNVACL